MLLLASRLKILREELGFSQKEFAQKLDMKATTYNGYETGQHEPKSDILIKLSEVFDVSVDYLVGISDIKNPPSKNKDSLSIREREMLNRFNTLNDIGQKKVLQYICDILKIKEYLNSKK